MSESKPLKKVRFRKEVFSGVCAGIAYSTGVSVFIIRLLTLVSFFVFTPATVIIVYVLAAIILPEWDTLPEDYVDRAENSL